MSATVRDVLWHLAAGFVLLAVLLAMPTAALDLPVRFPVTGVAVYLAAVPLILAVLPDHLPGDRFGPANAVTLVRLSATAVLSAALALTPGELADARLEWFLAVLAFGAFILDGVDGWIARRAGVDSAFGARFDMELDAFVTLVLAALVWRLDMAGAWVLAAGMLRYAFIAAAALWPLLKADLPPSNRRRFACALMVGTLSAVIAPAIPAAVSVPAVAGVLAFLAWSFAADVAWLLRHKR
ncbi:CDP-alcohol phosphatidyltransferase [Caenispirillum salinarum AK4]|uniref:CDP-alcohol phosphatidyltransferase n=1 Tax=Caenispirillum salinarum AK4 TaxID=1238182 RepID=K9GV14_9PROT|nr:CDP-alcohol phosphatidyltransferase family protein [Caenispirillum salinarum]EKV28569.1 CDP-alcohol phosphatidyltransferase [Caenispirillum salinarum AK4]